MIKTNKKIKLLACMLAIMLLSLVSITAATYSAKAEWTLYSGCLEMDVSDYRDTIRGFRVVRPTGYDSYTFTSYQIRYRSFDETIDELSVTSYTQFRSYIEFAQAFPQLTPPFDGKYNAVVKFGTATHYSKALEFVATPTGELPTEELPVTENNTADAQIDELDKNYVLFYSRISVHNDDKKYPLTVKCTYPDSTIKTDSSLTLTYAQDLYYYRFNPSKLFSMTAEGAYTLTMSTYLTNEVVLTYDYKLPTEEPPTANYTITYNLNGGKMSGQVTSYNINTETYTLPTPTRENYTFNGWYENATFTGSAVIAIAKGSTGDIVLHAKWVDKSNDTDPYNFFLSLGEFLGVSEADAMAITIIAGLVIIALIVITSVKKRAG